MQPVSAKFNSDHRRAYRAINPVVPATRSGLDSHDAAGALPYDKVFHNGVLLQE